MSGAQAITFNPTVLAAIAAACVGFIAFWSNPERLMNRAFFSGSLHAAAWLMSLQLALTTSAGEAGLLWLKVACSVGAFLPLHMWVIQKIITARLESSL